MSVQVAVTRASMQLGAVLVPSMVVFSGSNAAVENWMTRNVPPEDVTVIAEEAAGAGSYMSLLQSTIERVAALEEREAEILIPRLRNIVAQVLKHACGRQHVEATSDTDFFSQLGSAHPGVQRLASSMGVAPQQLVYQADQSITRRNKSIHPNTLAALEEEVGAVQRCITPALQRKCSWECRLFMAYDDVKAAFPDAFQVCKGCN
jgi:hypothetical protein